jgi:phage baseplate assembly protein W
MKTLALINGDLQLAQGGYRLFTGTDRVRQDLTLALLEEYNTDRFHPRWGSVIMRYIGNVISPELQLLVQAEVNRVVQNYIAICQAEILRDTVVDVKNRFNTSDVIRRIIDIQTSTFEDRINVALRLETLARETITIKKQVTG